MNRFLRDIKDFHKKFGISYSGLPRELSEEISEFRIKFLQEELDEYEECSDKGDLAGMLDALVDLAYVLFGTAHMHGFPFEEAWERVQTANMKKVRAKSSGDSKRNSPFDVVKPKGWQPPILDDLVKGEKMRPDWDDYFIGFLDKIRLRSTCDRGMTAALIVDGDRQIISSGYAGAPAGVKHCDELGHILENRRGPAGDESEHCIRTVHAEQNAIAQAAKRGVSTKFGTLYCTIEPCYSCAKLIAQCGIRRVIAVKKYQAGRMTRKLFQELGIELKVMMDETQDYEE